MAENDDVRNAHRRQLLKAGALAVPIVAAGAVVWSQPTVVQAIGVPMAAHVPRNEEAAQITVGLNHYARGAAVSGNGVFSTFFPRSDSAAATVNGALYSDVIAFYRDEYSTAWWGGPVTLRAGWVLDMPLTYLFPDDWVPDTNRSGPGMISVGLETRLLNSDGTKSEVESIEAAVNVLPHEWGNGPGLD